MRAPSERLAQLADTEHGWLLTPDGQAADALLRLRGDFTVVWEAALPEGIFFQSGVCFRLLETGLAFRAFALARDIRRRNDQPPYIWDAPSMHGAPRWAYKALRFVEDALKEMRFPDRTVWFGDAGFSRAQGAALLLWAERKGLLR